jgi:hypothetical protein
MNPHASDDFVNFIVHKDGYASLYVGGKSVAEVDFSRGLDEACNIFNKIMKQRQLRYRLTFEKLKLDFDPNAA